MKVDIKPLVREDYRNIFNLLKTAETVPGFHYYDQFCLSMGNRTGFTHWVDGKVVGLISFSDYFPGLSVMIHATFCQSYVEAMNRKVIRNTFDYAFNKLMVKRIDTYSIVGVTDGVVKFIERLGFVEEGCKRRAVELENKLYDVVQYGMLKEECRWI